MDCIFCKIASGEIKGDIVCKDDEVVAFRDVNPQAPHHILIIPRRHVSTLNDFGDDDQALLGKLLMTAKRIAADIGVADDGYRLNLNTNRKAGQTVLHVHLHLLAGRAFGWPPG